MGSEYDPPSEYRSPESLPPGALPRELADFLATQTLVCFLHATTSGVPVFIVKAPVEEIHHLRGRYPIFIGHELHQHPAAPVIRTLLRLYDRPDAPLALETFTNVADQQQRADFAALIRQDVLRLLFYDDKLRLQLTKGVRQSRQDLVRGVLHAAVALSQQIPMDQYDFDRGEGRRDNRDELMTVQRG